MAKLEQQPLLLAFYGDDFTGSTDSLEALSLHGVRSVLLLEPLEPHVVRARFPHVQAIGRAGHSRTWSPARMDAELRPIFEQMRGFGAPLFHYKVCSTFDSSPEIGSIGRAIDIGKAVFGPAYVPLLVGAPVLRRYTLFANHFATVGDETFRLDRHPTMSRHPVTPMHEADLRLHLAQQTTQRVASFDILHLTGAAAEVDVRFDALLATSPDIVLFDVLDNERLATAGRLIWRSCAGAPLFVAGSSGVEYALVAHWIAAGTLQPAAPPAHPGAVDQIAVVSGSCSPETEQQIAWGVRQGFAEVALDTPALADPATSAAVVAAAVRDGVAALRSGRSLVVHTCSGPHDPRIAATNERLRALGIGRHELGARLGVQLGRIMQAVLREVPLRRVVLAGGDSSSNAAGQLGIYALEVIAPIAPGSPLCRAYAHDPALDGLQIILKGGQVGKADYFGSILQGGL